MNAIESANYYFDQLPSWEYDQIIDESISLVATSKDKLIGNYLEARTIVENLVESGDITFENEGLFDVNQFKYELSKKAESQIKEVNKKFKTQYIKDIYHKGEDDSKKRNQPSKSDSDGTLQWRAYECNRNACALPVKNE